MSYTDKGPEKIGELLGRFTGKKPPAYPWQELALRVINELNIPTFKRSAVFKVCKQNSKYFVEQCLNDTKELCHSGEKWRDFFKLVSSPKPPNKKD